MGYALPKAKSTVRFSLEQQKYLIDLFNAGVNDKNNRARPGAVAHDMLYHFDSEFCLTEAQILAYFSRLSSKQKLEGNQQIPSTSTPIATLKPTSTSGQLKKTQMKKKIIDIPLLNNDQEQELFEAKVDIEKRYNMRERLVKKIVYECEDDSDEEEEEL